MLFAYLVADNQCLTVICLTNFLWMVFFRSLLPIRIFCMQPIYIYEHLYALALIAMQFLFFFPVLSFLKSRWCRNNFRPIIFFHSMKPNFFLTSNNTHTHTHQDKKSVSIFVSWHAESERNQVECIQIESRYSHRMWHLCSKCFMWCKNQIHTSQHLHIKSKKTYTHTPKDKNSAQNLYNLWILNSSQRLWVPMKSH